MIRSFISLAFILVFIPTWLFAQKDSTDSKQDTLRGAGVSSTEGLLYNLSIPSPTAAGLVKYADIPVDYNTGVPNISIPIATVKGSQLELPISLSYHASGIKVDELSSWVGLNWSLNAGGVITRQIMGGPDESFGGDKRFNIGFDGLITGTPTRGGFYADYGFSLPKYDRESTDIQGGYEKHDKFLSAAWGYYDTAPDIFSFNVNGQAGKFYFDASRTVHFVPENDFKVEVDFAGYPVYEFTEFVLIGPDGTRYYFGGNNAFEKTGTERGYAYGGSYLKSSWFLTKIESADRQDQILLSYVDEGHSFFNLKQERYEENDDFSRHQSDPNTPYLAENTQSETKRLMQILTSQTQVDFVANTTREDISSNFTNRGDQTRTFSTPKGLDEIRIISRNNANDGIKHVLAYDYYQAVLPTFTNSFEYEMWFYSGPGNEDKKRLRLLQVQEQSLDGTISKPPYVFTYEPTPLIRRLSLQRDHWGFFNGQDNNKSLIDHVYMNPRPNRSPSWIHMKNGHLQKISYPTGGSVEFLFEPHYEDASKGNYTGGLRIFKKTENFVNQPSVQTNYSYGLNIQPLNLSQYLHINWFPNEKWKEDFGENYTNPQEPAPAPFIQKCIEGSVFVPTALFIYSSSLYGLVGSFIGLTPHYIYVETAKTGIGKSAFEYDYFSSKYFYDNYPFTSGDLVNFVNSRKLIGESHYNLQGNLQEKTQYIYNPLPDFSASYVTAFQWEGAQKCGAGRSAIDARYFVSKYSYPPTRSLLLEKIKTTYDLNGENPNALVTKYGYGNNHESPLREAMEKSNGDSLITETKFVRDYPATTATRGMANSIRLMASRNINAAIEKLTFVKKSGETDADMKAIAGKLTYYDIFEGNTYILKPSSVYTLNTVYPVSVSRSNISGDRFAYDQNLYEKRASFSYGTNGLLATENLEKLSPLKYEYFSNGLLAKKTEALSSHFTQFEHSDLFGLKKLTGASGLNQYFEYDGLGKLSVAKDHNLHITNKWVYKYGGNANVSSSSIASNTAKLSDPPSQRVSFSELPPGFKLKAIRSPSGRISWLENESNVKLEGSDNMATSNNNFHYVYKATSGDVTIIARIRTDSLSTFCKRSSIMLRADTAANSPYLMVIYDVKASALGMIVRNAASGSDDSFGYTVHKPSDATPLWIRIKKVGNTYIGAYAFQSSTTKPLWSDDTQWTEIQNNGVQVTPSPALGSSYLIGFGIYNGATAPSFVKNSVFYDISINGNKIED